MGSEDWAFHYDIRLTRRLQARRGALFRHREVRLVVFLPGQVTVAMFTAKPERKCESEEKVRNSNLRIGGRGADSASRG